MASKKLIKKKINVLTGELLTECFAFVHFYPETKSKQVSETMWAIVHTRNELLSRINRKIPKEESVRSFYRNVKTDIDEMPALMDHFIG